MRVINHRDLEQCIGVKPDCDSYLQLKVAAYYSQYNGIVIASRRGEDRFFLASRDRKTDLSDAIVLSGRYLVIGDIDQAENEIFRRCVLQNKADVWLGIPDNLYLARLLIAGAIRVVVREEEVPNALAQTPEYQYAVKYGRVIYTCL